jgi:hypothetical protein
VCCSAPATKPPCGTKVVNIDPETGKPAKKDKATGLGHFRCSQCHKSAKVTPRKPEPKEAPQGNWGGLNMDPYPGKLSTTVIANIPLAPEGAVARVIGHITSDGIVVGTDPSRGTEVTPAPLQS